MSSEAKTQQKRPRWHIRDTEVRDAVRYCVMMRLTEKESLDELSNRKIHVSDRTFRRIKGTLEPDKKRLDKIVEEEYLKRTVISLDTLLSLQERLIELRKKKSTIWEELGIIREIRNISKDIFELYDSSPVVAALIKKLEKRMRR